MLKILNWQPIDYMRALIIVALIGFFGFALVHEIIWNGDAQTKNLLIGALIGSFTTGAIQFPFGTTPSSSKKDDTIAQMAVNTSAALAATPGPMPVSAPTLAPQVTP